MTSIEPGNFVVGGYVEFAVLMNLTGAFCFLVSDVGALEHGRLCNGNPAKNASVSFVSTQ